jgi:hypothetical protein
MRVLGMDFTSNPGRRKAITALHCTFDDGILHAERLEEWRSLDQFESALQADGQWIAGIDFPFGQSRKFIINAGWPESWAEYVAYAASLGRANFRAGLDGYRQTRATGDREHRRQTDLRAGSVSPQKLYGVPVGLMFFEGAPRLLTSGVTIPWLRRGDPDRIAVEAYPGLLARRLIGRRSYKNDAAGKRTADHYCARCHMLNAILGGALTSSYGLHVRSDLDLVSDPTGDRLDSLLCAIQAAWAWSKRDSGFGAPDNIDALEGWIADPALRSPTPPT